MAKSDITINNEKALMLINCDTASPATKIIGCLALASILANQQSDEMSQVGFIESLGTISALYKHLAEALNRIQDAALDESEA